MSIRHKMKTCVKLGLIWLALIILSIIWGCDLRFIYNEDSVGHYTFTCIKISISLISLCTELFWRKQFWTLTTLCALLCLFGPTEVAITIWIYGWNTQLVLTSIEIIIFGIMISEIIIFGIMIFFAVKFLVLEYKKNRQPPQTELEEARTMIPPV